MNHPAFPLALNYERAPFQPPSNAVAWRVRRVQPRWAGFDVVTAQPRSNPPTQLAANSWVPLVLHLRASPRELERAVARTPGLYRLDLVDREAYLLAWTPAYCPVAPTGAWGSSDPEANNYLPSTFRRVALYRAR